MSRSKSLATVLVVSVVIFAAAYRPCAAQCVFTTNTTIDCGDTSCENQDVTVRGCTLTGTGTIAANGGTGGGYYGGGGGGGRIALKVCDMLMDPGYVLVNGGAG